MGGIHNMLLGTAITSGKLTLKEVVFNASGTFTMPNDVVNNQIIVGCTGGGGGGISIYDIGDGGGPGSGRVVSTLTMSPGATATVIVGAGGNGVLGAIGGIGGTSSFTGATSCDGGAGGRYDRQIAGTSGGGHNRGGYSSVAAALVLASGSTDKTSGLWTAKSYGGPNASYGGGGCYGGGGYTDGIANTGGGAGAGFYKGGSGKVVVWYYIYE